MSNTKFKKGLVPWNKGIPMREESRKKLSESQKGKVSWNKGKKIPEMSGENHPMFGKHHSEESKKKMSEAHKGKATWIGKHHSEETKRKISEIKKRLYSEGKIIHPMKGKKTGKPAWNSGKKGLIRKDMGKPLRRMIKNLIESKQILSILIGLVFILLLINFSSAKTTISSCGTINSTGAYSLNQSITNANGTCLTIAADNVSIDGVGFTITGNISASGNSTRMAYTGLNIINITIVGTVQAKGSDGTGVTNDGGDVTAINSIISTIVTSGGVICAQSCGGGAGGKVIVTNSSINVITTLGNGEGGSGGDVIITNSTITTISASGNAPGCGGTITIINSQLDTNNISITSSGSCPGDGTLILNQTSFYNANGSIKFKYVSTKNTAFASIFSIANNSAYVNSIGYIDYNVGANVTLFDIGNRGFANVSILKDGGVCSDCYNFTPLTASTVIFNVSSWSNYSIGEETDSITPQINFTSPTRASGSSQTSKDIVINVTSSDANLRNFTIYLYNLTHSLINSSLNNSANNNYVSFNNLADGVYYFNATAYDIAGNSNSTETRNITIYTETIIPPGGGGGGGGSTPLITTISDTDLASGYSQTMGINNALKFNVGGGSHSLTVKRLTTTTITIEITSNPINATMAINDTRKFEITEDGYYDLQVTLNSIANGKANLTVQSVHEQIVKPAEQKQDQLNESEIEKPEEKVDNFIIKNKIIILVVIVALVILGVLIIALRMKKQDSSKKKRQI
jgi:hypothetical protein